MGIRFRKSFGIGPFRTTLTHRGVTNSVGAKGLRYSKTTRYSNIGGGNQGPSGNPEIPQSSNGKPILGFFILAGIVYVVFKLLF